MRKALQVIGTSVVVLATSISLISAWAWSKRHVDWLVPLPYAKIKVNSLTSSSSRLYKSTAAPFALAPNRTLALIYYDGDKQTYVILSPGPGHLPEGFRGSIRRCESFFVATPVFGFAHDDAECAPRQNRDDSRHAEFGDRFVEFDADDGKRLRIEW